MIGTGYVGLVTGACLAELGHRVICVDKDRNKIAALKAGSIPIYEPGLDKLVQKNVKAKRLSFTSQIKEGVQASEIIFIAVNTPPLPNGGADLSFVETCTREVAQHAKGYKLLVEKSTVPVQTGERIQKTLATMNSASDKIEVASNPEFLKEGTAIQDFLKPDRIVIGVGSKKAEKLMRELYGRIKSPLLVTDIKSAELIKHASNSFLALKISYINAIANICEKVGADVSQVAEGMGYDARIGKSFLKAGIGYGGSCFPKDVSAFIKIAEHVGVQFDLLKATEAVNNNQRSSLIKKIEEMIWTFRDKTVAVWGLAFKPDTDDLRNAPSKDVIEALLAGGANVKVFDPVAMEKMKTSFPKVTYCRSLYEAAEGADALVLVTEWSVFKKADLRRVKKLMRAPIFIDGRNVFNPEQMRKAGYHYVSIGRPQGAQSKHSAKTLANT